MSILMGLIIGAVVIFGLVSAKRQDEERQKELARGLERAEQEESD
jgi:hypothetical protein